MPRFSSATATMAAATMAAATMAATTMAATTMAPTAASFSKYSFCYCIRYLSEIVRPSSFLKAFSKATISLFLPAFINLVTVFYTFVVSSSFSTAFEIGTIRIHKVAI